jgi:hypothetical protein
VILIPELELVMLLTPKVASGSIRRAIVERYPRAIMLYRHMEADGVPAGYDRWQKVGVVREPVSRLWSLYKFLADFDGDHEPAYLASMRASVGMSFSDWIIGNQLVFTNPYDTLGSERFFPRYTVRHCLPENRKSQFVYLRPDLGTQVYRYDELAALEHRLDIKLTHRVNFTPPGPAPALTDAARDHIARFFAWDAKAAAPARERRDSAIAA